MTTPTPPEEPTPSAAFDPDTEGDYVCSCGRALITVHPEDRALTGAKLCPICDHRAILEALRKRIPLRLEVPPPAGEVSGAVRQMLNTRISFDPASFAGSPWGAAQAVAEPGERTPTVGQAWVAAPGQSEPQQVRLLRLDQAEAYTAAARRFLDKSQNPKK